jgi:CheY-like chemotaxis protein/predicted regulator of Ras-like GTPase activity (Roadblock/LC7/MglB family)
MADTKGVVLIVDDDPLVRHSLQRVLTGEGYDVEAAENVDQALKTLRQRLIDLVITDLQMPGENGLALTKLAKARRAELPVVMLTGHGSMDVVVEALRYGADDFLTKPYQPDELLQIVAREVARHRQSLPPGLSESIEFQLKASDFDAIDDLLVKLRADVNAYSVMVIEGNGSVLSVKGAAEDLNVSALGALIAGDFAATAGIAAILGEENAFELNFHEGAQQSIYAAEVTDGIYLLVIFGEGVRMGMVLYYMRNTVKELQALFDKVSPPPAPRPRKPDRQEERNMATTSDVTAERTAASTVTSFETTSSKASSDEAVPSKDASSDEASSETSSETSSGELYSFDEIMKSGLLNEELTTSLEEEFDSLWQSD